MNLKDYTSYEWYSLMPIMKNVVSSVISNSDLKKYYCRFKDKDISSTLCYFFKSDGYDLNGKNIVLLKDFEYLAMNFSLNSDGTHTLSYKSSKSQNNWYFSYAGWSNTYFSDLYFSNVDINFDRNVSRDLIPLDITKIDFPATASTAVVESGGGSSSSTSSGNTDTLLILISGILLLIFLTGFIRSCFFKR